MACDFFTVGLLDGTKMWVLAVIQVLHDYELQYNTHRPHTGLASAAPLRPLPPNVTDVTVFRGWQTRCAGGVISEYQMTI